MKNLDHLAIIPDGNRRWAKNKGLPSFLGHKAGGETMEKIISVVFDLGIRHLTIWGASVANVTERTKEETDFLFSVFENSFNKLVSSSEIIERKVRVRIMGEWRERFPEGLKRLYEEITEKTKENAGPSLTFMMAYSGTGEMVQAAKALAEKKNIDPSFQITKETLKENLMTADLPPVDLVIRTGGEPHWSDGFMMFDTANSQLYFTETFWPDFSEKELSEAVSGYSNIERRMGA